MYEHGSYEIVNVNCSQVTVKSGEDVVYNCNSSHVTKFEDPSPHLEQETTNWVDAESSKSQESQTLQLNSEERLLNNLQTSGIEVRQLSRSKKGKKPDRLNFK